MRILGILILLMLALGVGGYFWFSDSIPGFPKLSTGTYFGKLSLNNGSRSLDFFLDVDSKTDFYIVLLDVDVNYNIGKIDFEAEQSHSILRIRLKDELLELAGECQDKICHGRVEGHEALAGDWILQAVSQKNASEIEITEPDLLKYRDQRDQHDELEVQISKSEAELVTKNEEYKQYEDLVTAGSDLKEISDAKYAELQNQLKEADRIVREKKALLLELQGRLSVALRRTSYGKLVELSRESDNVENELLQISSRTAELSSPENKAKLEEGEKINDIKRQMVEERDRIFDLQKQP